MRTPTELLDPKTYISTITDKIESAERRVVLFTHIIAYDDSTKALVTALCTAAKRGVSVEVASDVFSFGILGGYAPLRNRGSIGRLRTMRRTFKSAGVRYRWFGKFGPFLFAGRTHVKWCVIDDIVYSFGGVNLYQNGLATADFMLQLSSTGLADQIEEEHHRISRADYDGRWYRSHSFACEYGIVLIDGGKPLDSIIYRRACELAEKASTILFVSQYCPTGRLGKLMAAKKSLLYFSPWQLIGGTNRLLIRSSMAFTGYKTEYKRAVYIHAKFIIYTMPNGSKVALTGSHNFVWAGVVLGTREIALETSDPQIIKQLENFHNTYIA